MTDRKAAKHPWGEHAPSRVVFGALAEDRRFRPFHAVFDEGVENNTRGRVCSPRFLDTRWFRHTQLYGPLAAGLAGELGDPKHLGKLDSLCAYAGIVPRTLQGGGPDSPAVQSAQKIHLYGPPELKDRITRWNANGQHGIFAAARHHLRLVSTLVKNEIPYLSPEGRTVVHPDDFRDALAAEQRPERLLGKRRSRLLQSVEP
jgi:hypothetical protein